MENGKEEVKPHTVKEITLSLEISSNLKGMVLSSSSTTTTTNIQFQDSSTTNRIKILG